MASTWAHDRSALPEAEGILHRSLLKSRSRLIRGRKLDVLSAAWSPDGQRLATGIWDNIAKVWGVATGRELLTFKGHKGDVLSLAWSPDGFTAKTVSRP